MSESLWEPGFRRAGADVTKPTQTDFSQTAIDQYNSDRLAAEQALTNRVEQWTGVPETDPYLARVDYDTAMQTARDTLEAARPAR